MNDIEFADLRFALLRSSSLLRRLLRSVGRDGRRCLCSESLLRSLLRSWLRSFVRSLRKDVGAGVGVGGVWVGCGIARVRLMRCCGVLGHDVAGVELFGFVRV